MAHGASVDLRGGGCSCFAASAQWPLPHPGGLRRGRCTPRECPEPSSAPGPPRLASLSRVTVSPTQTPRGARPASVPAGGVAPGSQLLPLARNDNAEWQTRAPNLGVQERWPGWGEREREGPPGRSGRRSVRWHRAARTGVETRDMGGGRIGRGQEKPEGPSLSIPGTWDLQLPSALRPTSSPPCRE
jgi:hypothetical protein